MKVTWVLTLVLNSVLVLSENDDESAQPFELMKNEIITHFSEKVLQQTISIGCSNIELSTEAEQKFNQGLQLIIEAFTDECDRKQIETDNLGQAQEDQNVTYDDGPPQRQLLTDDMEDEYVDEDFDGDFESFNLDTTSLEETRTDTESDVLYAIEFYPQENFPVLNDFSPHIALLHRPGGQGEHGQPVDGHYETQYPQGPSDAQFESLYGADMPFDYGPEVLEGVHSTRPIEQKWHRNIDLDTYLVDGNEDNESLHIEELNGKWSWTHALTMEAVEQVQSHGCFCRRLNPLWESEQGDTMEALNKGGKPLDHLDAICRDWLHQRVCTERSAVCEDLVDPDMRNNSLEYYMHPQFGCSIEHMNDGCRQTICLIDSTYVLLIVQHIHRVISETGSFEIIEAEDFDNDKCAAETMESGAGSFGLYLTHVWNSLNGSGRKSGCKNFEAPPDPFMIDRDSLTEKDYSLLEQASVVKYSKEYLDRE